MLNSCICVWDNDIISYTFAFRIQLDGLWRLRRSGHRNTKCYKGTWDIGSYGFIWGIYLAANGFIDRSNSFEALAPEIVILFVFLQRLLGRLLRPHIARIVLPKGLDAITPEHRLRLFNNDVILLRNLANASLY